MSEPNVPVDHMVFRCPECGKTWEDPPTAVRRCYRGHDPVDVEVIQRPGDTA